MRDQLPIHQSLCVKSYYTRLHGAVRSTLIIMLALGLYVVAQAQDSPTTRKPSAGERDQSTTTRTRPRRLTQTPVAKSSPTVKEDSTSTGAKVTTDFKTLSDLINLDAQQGHLERAHARVDQALRVQPKDASLHFLKAQVYGMQKKTQEAETALRRTLEIDPNYIQAYFALGALYINTNQQERAIAEFTKIVERKPDDPGAYTLLGMLEQNRQNLDAAVKNYRKALELDPETVLAANNLAWLYADNGLGELSEAERLAQGVIKQHPDVPGFVDTLGWIFYKKGLHTAAIEQFQKALAKEENNPTYYYHLGMALAGKGDMTGARRAIEKSLQLSEKNSQKAAEAALKAPAVKDDAKESLPAAKEVKAPDRIAALRAQLEEAKTESERALLQFTLVDSLIALNREKEAIKELREMMRQERFDPVGFYNIGNALARLGDTDTAIDAYRKAIDQRHGNYPRALNNLGVMLLRKGRWDEAEKVLTSAIKQEGFRYAEASYNLGRVYEARGEVNLAIREWKRALAVQPDHTAAALALGRVAPGERNPK